MRVDVRVLLAASAVALAGCGSVSDVVGTGKDAPDEFAIVTKQPLIIPPEFNLHPPRPGAAPTNQLSPTDSAQAALFSGDPKQIAGTIHGNYSQGEKILLARAGAANATDSIRQLIAADDRNLEAADNDFTNSLLFGSEAGAGHPLNANAEKARLDSQKGARPVADAGPLPQQTTAPADDYAAPQGAYQTQSPTASRQPAVGGTLPPLGGEPAPQQATQQSAPQQPVPASAPAPATAPPRTASTYAPPQAGTLPPIDGTDAPQQQTYQPSRPHKKAHKDDSGWFDGIF